MTELDRIKALTFDVGGTVFDWHGGIRTEVAALAARRGNTVDAPQFALDWRRRMFELLAKVRSNELPWMNADQLHRLALDDIASAHPGLPLSADDRDDLNRVWHRLPAWPDFAPALERLRERYTVVVLTVVSWAIVVDSSKTNRLSWDGILSCEFLGVYKPDPGAYLAGARLLGLEPAEVMMVAAHPGDLRAAMAAGFASAYVPRLDERGPGTGDLSPMADATVSAADFADLARRIA